VTIRPAAGKKHAVFTMKGDLDLSGIPNARIMDLVLAPGATLSTGGGISDARYMRRLCPVVELGLVGATMHAVDECAPVADVLALVTMYSRIIERYFAAFAAPAPQ
jgi:acetylornithine deacetylase/succinyl-diaminopimelate desuccinylase-like protein